MTHRFWHGLTQAGDSALMLPLIIWIALWLLLQPIARRPGARWLIAVAAAAGLTCLTKLAFMGWGVGIAALDFTGLSGHGTLALLVWPSLGVLLAQRAGRWVRAMAYLPGLLLGLAVALSRVVLHAHSTAEAVLGALAGIAASAWFVYRPPQARSSIRSVLLLAAGAAVITVICYGHAFPSQGILKHIALTISGRSEVFKRAMFETQ